MDSASLHWRTSTPIAAMFCFKTKKSNVLQWWSGWHDLNSTEQSARIDRILKAPGASRNQRHLVQTSGTCPTSAAKCPRVGLPRQAGLPAGGGPDEARFKSLGPTLEPDLVVQQYWLEIISPSSTVWAPGPKTLIGAGHTDSRLGLSYTVVYTSYCIAS